MEYRTLEDPENVSEAQVDKKIIPAITDLDVPLVINSRLKKLTKAIQEAEKVSWESRNGTVEDEDVPLTISEMIVASWGVEHSRVSRTCPRHRWTRRASQPSQTWAFHWSQAAD